MNEQATSSEVNPSSATKAKRSRKHKKNKNSASNKEKGDLSNLEEATSSDKPDQQQQQLYVHHSESQFARASENGASNKHITDLINQIINNPTNGQQRYTSNQESKMKFGVGLHCSNQQCVINQSHVCSKRNSGKTSLNPNELS